MRDSVSRAIWWQILPLLVRADAYTPPAMEEWPDLRRKYLSEWTRRRKQDAANYTQPAIAERGGIAQSRLSELLNDAKYTPDINTFLRLLKGLGFASILEFALQVSHRTKADSTLTVGSATKGSFPDGSADPHLLAELSKACLHAAERLDRGVPRRLLAEFAFAFGVASDPNPEKRADLKRRINERIS